MYVYLVLIEIISPKLKLLDFFFATERQTQNSTSYMYVIVVLPVSGKSLRLYCTPDFALPSYQVKCFDVSVPGTTSILSASRQKLDVNVQVMASIANANPTITIPRIDASSLSGSFHIEATYVLQNLPVILFNAGVEQWRAWKDWRSHGDDKSHHINFEHLDSNFGQVTAPVTNCKSGHSIVLSVTNFLSAWKEAATSSKSPPLRYMKDWHLVRDFPDYQGYEIPKPYVTDWLNDWWTDPLGRALWRRSNNENTATTTIVFVTWVARVLGLDYIMMSCALLVGRPT